MFDSVVGPVNHALTVYVDSFLWFEKPAMDFTCSEFWQDIEYHVYDMPMASWEAAIDSYLARECSPHYFAAGPIDQCGSIFRDGFYLPSYGT